MNPFLEYLLIVAGLLLVAILTIFGAAVVLVAVPLAYLYAIVTVCYDAVANLFTQGTTYK